MITGAAAALAVSVVLQTCQEILYDELAD